MPTSTRINDFNQQALFKRVAAVALACAPQVVIPQMFDQHYWAQRFGWVSP
jgi:vancomycin aglycone glucosyltransferase